MSDELQDAEHRATRLADQVETLRGQNDTLAQCIEIHKKEYADAIAERDTAKHQRDGFNGNYILKRNECGRAIDERDVARTTVRDLRAALKVLAAARNEARQQLDELHAAGLNIARRGGKLTGSMWNDFNAALAKCGLPAKESVGRLRTAAEYAIARLDDRLERAHDSSGYDEAVAIRDAAQSLSSGCAVTVMEADALIAELDAIAATGGPLDDTDDPAYNPEPKGN